MKKIIQRITAARRVFSLAIIFSLLCCFAAITQADKETDVKAEAQKFIDQYSQTWNELRYQSSQAEWNANIKIVEGDDTNAKATNAAEEKLSAFTGSKTN